MNVEELRLECLRLAVNAEHPAASFDPETAIKAAEQFATFVLDLRHPSPDSTRSTA
jgi:hypothetical protein